MATHKLNWMVPGRVLDVSSLGKNWMDHAEPFATRKMVLGQDGSFHGFRVVGNMRERLDGVTCGQVSIAEGYGRRTGVELVRVEMVDEPRGWRVAAGVAMVKPPRVSPVSAPSMVSPNPLRTVEDAKELYQIHGIRAGVSVAEIQRRLRWRGPEAARMATLFRDAALMLLQGRDVSREREQLAELVTFPEQLAEQLAELVTFPEVLDI